MEIYVGTSGWFYSWNKEKNFTWYVENSRLNAVESTLVFIGFLFPIKLIHGRKKGKISVSRLKYPVGLPIFII